MKYLSTVKKKTEDMQSEYMLKLISFKFIIILYVLQLAESKEVAKNKRPFAFRKIQISEVTSFHSPIK